MRRRPHNKQLVARDFEGSLRRNSKRERYVFGNNVAVGVDYLFDLERAFLDHIHAKRQVQSMIAAAGNKSVTS
jgi:hypothetical protein